MNNTTSASVYRHGDLDIFPVDKKLSGKSVSQIVLEEGEFTGHYHTLKANKGASVKLMLEEADNIAKKYFEVKGGGATIDHPEHKTIDIPDGTYEVRIEKEYDPFLKKINEVKD